MNDLKLFHWETGEQITDVNKVNFKTTDVCDNCHDLKIGTTMHAAGATGRVCPVVFICDDCRG